MKAFARRGGPWIAVFLLVNAWARAPLNTNPLSRYAQLCAMAVDGSFRIDRFREMTIDWARTPDGHYYSNKAPGPAFAAYPLFAPVAHGACDASLAAWAPSALHTLSFFLQALPMAAAAAFGAAELQAAGASAAAVSFFAAAALFGNTAALLTNSFFGHAMAAACALGMLLALRKRCWAWAGFLFGWAALSDYGAALLLPAALLYLRRGGERGALPRLAAGALLPAALGAWYHAACFGAPWALPFKFQNPEFTASSAGLAWGVIAPVPSPAALFGLLFGAERGLLWTQPWLLLAAGLIGLHRKRLDEESRRESLFVLAGLGLLLWMNASFQAWRGGNAPGPRYLACGLPLAAWPAARLWDRLPAAQRRLLSAALALSLAFFALAFARSFPEPGPGLWPYYLRLETNRTQKPDDAQLAPGRTAG